MGRLMIALALCGALAGGSVWSLHAVEQTVLPIAAAVEAGRTEQAYAAWEDAQPLLGALLLHDELDAVGRLFARVRAAAPDSADAAELSAQLRHLPDLQRPSITNIF